MTAMLLAGVFSASVSCAADIVVSTPTFSTVNLAGNSLTVTEVGSITAAIAASIQNSTGGFILNNGSMIGSASGGAIDISSSTISGSITNNGLIANSVASGSGINIENRSVLLGNLINNGTINITGSANSHGMRLGGTGPNQIVGGIVNNGSILNSSSDTYASAIRISNLNAIVLGGITNTGLISTASRGITSESRIEFINNSGIISTRSHGISSRLTLSVGTITNTGLIISTAGFGIDNTGSISVLNNGQGAGISGQALTYRGLLPTSYNTIINGNAYGQLAATNASGAMTFGISPLSQNVSPRTYSNVLSGVTPSNLSNQTGTYQARGQFTLTQQGNSGIWDLTLTGAWNQFIGFDNPNTTNTYLALDSNRQAVEGILHQRYAVLNAVMQYDCHRFDKYGVCVQFMARASGFGSQATGAGVINAAYRFAEKFRVGAYLDYQVAQGHPSGLNLGTGGVQQGYNNPTFGGYVGYSENLDGTGIQARVSGGYNPGSVSVARGILVGTEPGFGTAGLNAYYAFGVAGYGVNLDNKVIVTPYAGLQYTDVTRNAYTEQANLLTTMFPMSYVAYYERLVTGLVGAKANGMLTAQLGYQFGMGAQIDFSRAANSYGGYSYVPGMETFGIAHGGAWNGVRPAGLAGIFYDVLPNHRISLDAYVSQQAWSTRAYTTGLLSYRIAF